MVRPVGGSVGSCGSCGNDLRVRSRFCDVCGTPVSSFAQTVEHKHVTVLFADVVGSMRLATAVDSERLREIMNELFNRSAAVVQRYQGTMDKFTGDGLMALFGAPIAMEDHALRACIAGLEIQASAAQLANDVRLRDGVDLRLRVGLNSGDVIVGEIGSGPGRYTAVGHAVGLAQRMEAAAPPGAVLCSLATARLVENSTRLGPEEHVLVKDADAPVPARLLIAVEAGRMVVGRNEGLMLGRDSELCQLYEAVGARCGRLVSVVGAPGVGKSRLIDEFGAQLGGRSADVVVSRCDAHAMPVAFGASARFLRAMFGVEKFSEEEARTHTAASLPAPSALPTADVQILFEAMGVADGTAPPLQVGADGRRHRLVEIMSQVVRARKRPIVFILEDAHWADTASDAVLADFARAIRGTPATFIFTQRPEFHGALVRVSDVSICMQPLPESASIEQAGYLLGPDPSLVDMPTRIANAAGGNPYFVEEIVRDLAGRGVLAGGRGNYCLVGDAEDLGVPATVQAVLAARIDRLAPAVKTVLNAAAVIGTRFDAEALEALVPDTRSSQLAELVASELIDQTEFAPRQRYCFRHPLVRTVAYESQLSATRAQAHRDLAAAIQNRATGGEDENAALIASHLEAAGDLARACQWHLRAADWLRPRDLLAARAQWECALEVSDQLSDDDDGVIALRIAPRAMLVSTELFIGEDPANDRRFAELRELTTRGGDLLPLAIAMAGRIMAFSVNCRREREGLALSEELEVIIGSLDEAPVAEREILLTAMAFAKLTNSDFDAVRRIIDTSLALPRQEPSLDSAVAFALGGLVEVCTGNRDKGLRQLRMGTDHARAMSPVGFSAILIYWGMLAGMGLHIADDLLDDLRGALADAHSFGDRFGIIAAQWAYGTILLRADPASRDEALRLLEEAGNRIRAHNLQVFALAIVDVDVALAKARSGDRDQAIDQLRALVRHHLHDGALFYLVRPAEALIELLTARGSSADLDEAAALIDEWRLRRTDAPTMNLWWQKSLALLAKARGESGRFAELAQEYWSAAVNLNVPSRAAEAQRMLGDLAGIRGG